MYKGVHYQRGLAHLGVIVATVLAAFVIFAAGWFVGTKNTLADRVPAFAAEKVPADQPEGIDLTPLWRVWNVIDERYVDAYATSTTATTTPEDAQKRVWGMVQGLAASLGDPYTVFLPPGDAQVFQDDISGSFEGVGMEIAIRDQVLTIVSPLKGTPAFRSGLKSADRIIEIDGVSTEGMNVDEAVQLIRGPRGTAVVFTIVREGEIDVLSIEVIRDVIQIPTIETEFREDGVFVIELLNFSGRSPDLFRKALREFVATESNLLIVDLRGNPGGFLEAAVDMASWFLPKGKIVVTEDPAQNGEPRIHRSRGYDIFDDDLQLVFLIDRGSASASEILAGSLREYGVATLVGTRSFGKGSVQELIDITDDTSLKITVARWLLAGNVFITQEGIEPDIEVKLDPNTELEEGDDPVLERAVEFLLKGE